jgi:hypothetical protein
VTSGFWDGAKSKCGAMNSRELTKSEVFYWLYGEIWIKSRLSRSIVNGSRDSNR